MQIKIPVEIIEAASRVSDHLFDCGYEADEIDMLAYYADRAHKMGLKKKHFINAVEKAAKKSHQYYGHKGMDKACIRIFNALVDKYDVEFIEKVLMAVPDMDDEENGLYND